MPNLNRVMLMGNLTRDPEMRHLDSGSAVTQISIATNRKWKNKDGQAQEEVTFVDCEAWGKTAEAINQYMRKGRPIFVEGRLKLEQWDDKTDGSKRSKMKVVVETFQFLGDRDSNDNGGNSGGNQQRTSAPQQRQSNNYNNNEPAPLSDDDIPF
jgi:single-strand DNA-binding protein